MNKDSLDIDFLNTSRYIQIINTISLDQCLHRYDFKKSFILHCKYLMFNVTPFFVNVCHITHLL